MIIYTIKKLPFNLYHGAQWKLRIDCEERGSRIEFGWYSHWDEKALVEILQWSMENPSRLEDEELILQVWRDFKFGKAQLIDY